MDAEAGGGNASCASAPRIGRTETRYPAECSGPPHLLGPWGRPACKW